jgi:hypothetical protein
MRAARALLVVLALTIMTPLVEAQEMPTPPPPPEDAVMDARIGTWQGTGTMMGMQVTDNVTISWALGHHFVVSQSAMSMTMPDGQAMSMEMHMVTKVKGDGTYEGVYMDSWGAMGPFTGHVDEAGSVVTEWTDTETGGNARAVETLNPDGGWTMQYLSQGEDGTWVETGSMTYTRVAE